MLHSYEERHAYHPRVDVYFNDAAWATTDFVEEYLDRTIKTYVEAERPIWRALEGSEEDRIGVAS